MSRATLYDWLKMSPEHTRYAERNYPIAANIALMSQSHEKFMSAVQQLEPWDRVRYINEFNNWWATHGETWDRIGLPQEYTVGEVTSTFDFRPMLEDNPLRRPPEFRGFDVKLAGLETINYIGADQSYDDWESDLDIGSTPDPTVPSGYVWCVNPGNTRPTADWQNAEYGWRRQAQAGVGNEKYWYYAHPDTNRQLWACEKKTTYSNVADVKAIQTALKARGYNIGTTGVDGKVGKNTCIACYTAKQDLTGTIDQMLTLDFFQKLGVKGATQAFATRNARLCSAYFKYWTPKGMVQPKEPEPIKPKPKTPDKAPARPPLPAGYHWCLGTEAPKAGSAKAKGGPIKIPNTTWSVQMFEDGLGNVWGLYGTKVNNLPVLLWACPNSLKKAPIITPEEPKKAGIGWILAIIVGGTAVGMIIRNKAKKKGR